MLKNLTRLLFKKLRAKSIFGTVFRKWTRIENDFMKNTISLLTLSLFFAFSASAQSTADSISSKYKLLPMPAPLTMERSFPAIGAYQMQTQNGEVANITVQIDSANRGIVWVEGLPQGKFKAYLKQSPGLYRIVAQKTASGKSIPEGTLYFNPESSTLNIALGKAFNDKEPAAVFTSAPGIASGGELKVKNDKKGTKSKVVFYSAQKNAVTAEASTFQQ